jgi:hypothetical protein
MGCAGPTASPTVTASPSPGDLGGLVGALEAAGASVVDLGPHRPISEVLGSRGRDLCVDGQQVPIYLYASQAEAEAVAASIDREDPSMVGTAIIEWVGDPRFWQGGSLLVRYSGPDAAVEHVLTSVLGPPFAGGAGREPAAAAFSC